MSQEDRLDEILGNWMERRDRGERVSPEDVCAAHPELAEQLRERFAAEAIAEEVLGGASAEEMEAPPEIPGFRLIREIGRGGMGVVYEAEQLGMDRRVALKVLSAGIVGTTQAVKRFRREAQAAGRIHHTNIVPVYHMDQHAGRWFYAMELVQGRPLNAIIEDLWRADPLSNRETLAHTMGVLGSESGRARDMNGSERGYFVRVAELFAGVADALELAHAQGIVHRDVKPSNLLLDADGRLKIADFGLVRFDADKHSMTMTGDLLGTPMYMSPEQATAKTNVVDHRTDVYSLGATLYEVLTGSAPFQARDLPQLCAQILREDPTLPRRAYPRVPRDLETIVMKAMEKDPDKRYPHARDLSRDLRSFAEGGTIRARRIGLAQRTWRRAKRHKVRSILGASVVLLAVLGFILASSATRESKQRVALEYAQLCFRADQAAMAEEAATSWDPSGTVGFRALSTIESSRSLFSRAIQLAPSRFEAYLGRALTTWGGTREQRLEDLKAARARGLAPSTYRLARALVLVEAGQPEQDIDEEPAAGGASEDDPGWSAYLRARLRSEENLPKQALPLYARALHAAGKDPILRFRALRGRATIHAQLRDYESALADAVEARGLAGASVPLRLECARLWHLMGHEDRAEAQFQAVVEDTRALDTEAAWLVAVSAARTVEQALGPRTTEPGWFTRLSAAAVEAFPDALSLLILRTVALLGQVGQREEALAAADVLVATAEEDWFSHYMRGNALLNVGRHDDALHAYNRALEIEATSAGALEGRGFALFRLGRHEQALASFERALELKPSSALAHHGRARILVAREQREDALAAFGKAIAHGQKVHHENLHTFHYSRGVVLRDLGRHQDALREFDNAITWNPDYAKAHINRGQLLHDVYKQPEAALKAFDRAVALDESLAIGHRNRGIALQSLNRLELSLEAFARALALGNHEASVSRGAVLLQLKRFAEALEAVDAAMPHVPTVYRHWGMTIRAYALMRLGRSAAALEQFEAALSAGVSTPEVLNEIAWLRATSASLSLRDPARAVQLARAAAQQAPTNGHFWGTLGTALYRKGEWREALTALEKASSLAPQSAGCNWFFVAMTKWKLGEKEEARTWYDKAVKWTAEHKPDDEELMRFRAEAAELLGVEDAGK